MGILSWIEFFRKTTLFLCGVVTSPNFAKHLTFYLEGESSDLPEYEKFALSAPLYKTICTEVPVRPPYPEITTYEVWYTTKQPTYKGDVDIHSIFKPWSTIWSRKISRRLFLNKSEVKITKEKGTTSLKVAVTCFTNQSRLFWLLFRSKTSDFIVLLEIKVKVIENQTIVNGLYSETWSPSSTCICVPENKLKANIANCPYLTHVKIPTRNEALWDALRAMFLKAMHLQEKSFWDEHFETNIGICLILWLLSPDEETEIIDEFVEVLSTRVTYTLSVESNSDYVTLPSKIEILDVRDRSEFTLPVHISQGAPSKFDFQLTMTSENGKEVRSLKVFIQSPAPDANKFTVKVPSTLNLMCQPPVGKFLNTCCSNQNKNYLL